MKRGFSLVELSMVLVILGLLIGGILAGQSLVRASELRAVGTEWGRYQTAANVFRDKYFSIPGDFRDATRVWGRQTSNANCVTNSSASAVATGVCDGDSSGAITIIPTASVPTESGQFWRQLAAAGLIEGNFSGNAGIGGGNHYIIGTDSPASKLNGGGWSVYNWAGYAGDAWAYALDYGNMFSVGGQTTANVLNPLLKPEEAWNIDSKLDDGKPAYGKIIGLYWNNRCSAADDGTHANNDLAASYRLSDTTPQCALYFIKAF